MKPKPAQKKRCIECEKDFGPFALACPNCSLRKGAELLRKSMAQGKDVRKELTRDAQA